MPTSTLAPEDYDLDLQVEVPTQEADMQANKTGPTEYCSISDWVCC